MIIKCRAFTKYSLLALICLLSSSCKLQVQNSSSGVKSDPETFPTEPPANKDDGSPSNAGSDQNSNGNPDQNPPPVSLVGVAADSSVISPIVDCYNRAGKSKIGTPLGNVYRQGAGLLQDFSGSSGDVFMCLLKDGSSMAYIVHGWIRDTYLYSAGGPTGSLGFPAADDAGMGTDVTQAFEKGSIKWVASANVTFQNCPATETGCASTNHWTAIPNGGSTGSGSSTGTGSGSGGSGSAGGSSSGGSSGYPSGAVSIHMVWGFLGSPSNETEFNSLSDSFRADMAAAGLPTTVNFYHYSDSAALIAALNAVPKNQPLLVMGHSFGGSMVAHALPSVTRPIEHVILFDPVDPNTCCAYSNQGPSKGFSMPTNVKAAVDFYRPGAYEFALAELKVGKTVGCVSGKLNSGTNTQNYQLPSDRDVANPGDTAHHGDMIFGRGHFNPVSLAYIRDAVNGSDYPNPPAAPYGDRP